MSPLNAGLGDASNSHEADDIPLLYGFSFDNNLSLGIFQNI